MFKSYWFSHLQDLDDFLNTLNTGDTIISISNGNYKVDGEIINDILVVIKYVTRPT